MSKCREAFEKQYGEDFNPDHSPVASVWQAAWNAATKNAVEICEGQMTGVKSAALYSSLYSEESVWQSGTGFGVNHE